MSFTVHIWSSNVRPRVCHYQASLRALLCHKTESCCNLQIYSTVEHLFRLQSACQLILHSPVDVSWTNECWIIIRNEKRYFLFCFLFFLIRKYSKIILKLMFPSSQSPWQGVLIKWHCLGKYIIFKCYPEQHVSNMTQSWETMQATCTLTWAVSHFISAAHTWNVFGRAD